MHHRAPMKDSPVVAGAAMENAPPSSQRPPSTTSYSSDLFSSAFIYGPEEVRARVGATVSLDCIVVLSSSSSLTSNSRIIWRHDGREITAKSRPAGVSIDSERSMTSARSRLVLLDARVDDNGVYECSPAIDAGFDKVDSVSVVVITGGESVVH